MRYVKPHPAHSTTLILPLEHPFNTIPHSSTSLASKSEPEVDIYGVSVALACLPLPLQARASRRWIFMTFWHLRPPHHPCLHLPCIQDDEHARKPQLHQTYNLARLHSSVNWHSHCTCKVYWLALGRCLWMGLGTPRFLKTLTQTHQNPYPWGGCGYGSPWNTPGLPVTIPTPGQSAKEVEWVALHWWNALII